MNYFLFSNMFPYVVRTRINQESRFEDRSFQHCFSHRLSDCSLSSAFIYTGCNWHEDFGYIQRTDIVDQFIYLWILNSVNELKIMHYIAYNSQVSQFKKKPVYIVPSFAHFYLVKTGLNPLT